MAKITKEAEKTEAPVRRRGRPPRVKAVEKPVEPEQAVETAATPVGEPAPVVAEVEVPKPRRRGRPPKVKKEAAPEDEAQQLLLIPDAGGTEKTVEATKPEPDTAPVDEPAEIAPVPSVEPKPEQEPEAMVEPEQEPEPDPAMEIPAPMPASPDENAAGGTFPQTTCEVLPHPKPKHTYAFLASQTILDLRKIGKEVNVPGLTTLNKDDLILSILRAQAESMNYRFGGGTLEILPEGFGFLRPKGMLPTDNDVYLSLSQIRRFGLRNGDVIWGLIRPPREQEHYEALLRVETVNFSDPEHSRRRPMFSHLTPIFPNKRINLESGQEEWATRLVDMFAPIGLGQRALIVSPPKAGKTTLLKRIAKAISANSPDIILMALLIDERPEEVTDISRSIEGEVIASTFDRPADEHIRVASLAIEKAKRLAEAKRDVVILLDSITRLARASNLTVPPSGRTLSGGLDPSGLYFPKRFFGAARNFEEGGSLTIIGTALTDTGSRMDDVIYEEFKGTGNMELHLSRKLAEQRIFPAIDITRSGTRREELLIPEEELKRLWVLRKRIVGVDEAGALSLILDKLKQTKDNHEFLMSIKLA